MWRDVRAAARTLLRTPVLSAVVVISLGIGIGVNTAVFSWIQAFVLRPLPGVTRAAEFHLVEPRTGTGAYPGSSWPEYLDLRSRLPHLAGLLAFRMAPLNVGEPAREERVFALLVSGNYFTELGLTPALGRLIAEADTAAAGAAPVAVVSHGFWLTRLGGRPDAAGARVRVNGLDLTVVGVAPERFQGTVLGLQFDLWVPATMAPPLLNGSRELDDREARGYYVMGRLPDGGSLPAARAEAAAAMRGLADAHPVSNRDVQAEVLPFWKAPRGPQGRLLEALGVLQALMLLLLAAVCGNMAALLLAKGASRQREMGIRLAVGAGRGRVVRLLLAESLALGLLGAGLGALLATWGLQAIRAAPLTTALPIRFQTTVDATGLAVAVLLGVVSAVVFGLAPALQLASVEVPASIGARGGHTAAGLRRAAMAAEVALAMAVLIIAGLFVGGLSDARETHPGFEREGVLLAAYDLSIRNPDAAASRIFAQELLDRLRRAPGVQAAAIAASVPLDIHGLPLRPFSLEGRARTDGVDDRALSNVVTPGYFTVMGIPRVEGADFVELADTSAPPQVVVNQAFVDRYLSTGAVLGRRLTQGERTYVIIGVVRTSLSNAFGEPPTPCMYFSYRDRPARAGEMHVRSSAQGDASAAGAARAALREMDPTLPVFNIRTLADHVETNLLLRRVPARLFLALGPLLLVLAALGIYAVVAHTVAARTGEIGVRMAMGATPSRVVRGVMFDHLPVVGAGAAAGWILVWIVYARVFRGSLDGLAFAAVPALVVAVALVSCWVPARRAAWVSPVVALTRE